MRTRLALLGCALLGAILGLMLRGELRARPSVLPARARPVPRVAPVTADVPAAPATRAAAAAMSGTPAGAPAVHAVFAARPADEWQGMLVRMDTQPECETADTCGLALACIAGRCGPCRRDSDCLSGERCALDRCVRAQAFGCASHRDCRGDELCVLNGVSTDLRGNATMTSRCLAPRGGEPAAELPDDTVGAPDLGDVTTADELFEQLDPPAAR
jgi:hypothetical protein